MAVDVVKCHAYSGARVHSLGALPLLTVAKVSVPCVFLAETVHALGDFVSPRPASVVLSL